MISSLLSGNIAGFLFQILVHLLVFVTAIPLHEFAHAWVARKLGDPTAESMGRLNLNPLQHFDLIGTTLLLLVGFGWAKPVPINPSYFKNRKSGMALTALAGPVSNILLAGVILILYKVCAYAGMAFLPGNQMFNLFLNVLMIMVSTNINLAVFNLLPIPPLDGAKIFGFFMPDRIYWNLMKYEHIIGRVLMLVAILTPILDVPIRFLRNLVLQGLDFITGFVDILSRMLL